MPDPIFADPRLVAIYDHFDGYRRDLEHYLNLVRELNAKSIVDVGCGTGCFATLLSQHGFKVTGVDPAKASLNLAQKKPYADQVAWISGDASALPTREFDFAIMTGNVAQVFLEDSDWEKNLLAIRKSLRPQGHLVFEVRDPSRKAWLDWNREQTHNRLDIPGIGEVEGWCDLLEVSGELVHFRWTYVFAANGEKISSDSSLRFRDKDSILGSLEKTGYQIREIRDAPDRPGKEFVFIAEVREP